MCVVAYPFKYFVPRRAIIISFTLQVIVYAVGLVGIGYPIMDFLFFGTGSYGDLTDGLVLTPIYYSPELAAIPTFSQPNSPTTILLYRIFRTVFPSLNVTNVNLINWSLVMFLVFIVALISIYLLFKLSGSISIAILLGMSFPMLFSFGRANPDMFCFILLCSYLISIKNKSYKYAVILVALMGAFKLPFFIFSLLLILANKIKHWLLSLVLCGVFFYAPLSFFPYGFRDQMNSINAVASHYHRDYVLGEGGSLFNNSLFGFLKLTFYLSGVNIQDSGLLQVESNNLLVRIHLVIVFLALAGVAILLMLKRDALLTNFNKSRDDQIILFSTLLAGLAILLPFVSSEYRITMLLPSFALTFKSKTLDKNYLLLNSLLMALILLPKSFVQFTFQEPFLARHLLDSLVNPILICFVCILSVSQLVKVESPNRKRTFK